MTEVRAKKALGQHFLTDLNIARKIAYALSGGTSEAPAAVLEVGCGMGVLTQFLLRRGDMVTWGAEIDAESVEYLHAHYPEFTPRLIEGDFLKLDLRERFPEGVRIIGNFPYNISSQIFFKVLENRDLVPECVGMIQREVARRICAAPGTADYGAFSVFCQYHTRPELLFDVPPECFLPAPKVTSSVLRMVPCPPPPEVDDEAHFFRVVRAAFAQRRKTLVNSLSASLGGPLSKEEISNAVSSCGLPENIRGERLSISDFAALSKALRRAEG